MNIKDILEPFNLSIGKRQDLLTLMVHLRNNKITMDGFIKYLGELKIEQIELIKRQNGGINKLHERCNMAVFKCPECNTTMRLYPVNTNPGDQTEDDSKSVWVCPNRDCMENIYNKQTMQELLKNGGTK